MSILREPFFLNIIKAEKIKGSSVEILSNNGRSTVHLNKHIAGESLHNVLDCNTVSILLLELIKSRLRSMVCQKTFQNYVPNLTIEVVHNMTNRLLKDNPRDLDLFGVYFDFSVHQKYFALIDSECFKAFYNVRSYENSGRISTTYNLSGDLILLNDASWIICEYGENELVPNNHLGF